MHSRNSKAGCVAGVEQWGEGQVVRSRGSRGCSCWASVSLETGLWFYSKRGWQGRAERPGGSDIDLKGSLRGRGKVEPPRRRAGG